jgi:hypothetical protein
MKDRQKAEAIERLKALGLEKKFVDAFCEEGKIPIFYQFAIRYYDNELIDELESDFDGNDSFPRVRNLKEGFATEIMFLGEVWDCDSWYCGYRSEENTEETELRRTIQNFETESGALVYAANLRRNLWGQVLSLLFVGKDGRKWKKERMDKENNSIPAYVVSFAREVREVGVFTGNGRWFRHF